MSSLNSYANCHYFSYFHVDYNNISFRMSNLRNYLRDDNMCAHVDRFHVTYRFFFFFFFYKYPCHPVGVGGGAS